MNKITFNELSPAFCWLVKKGKTRQEVAEFFGVSRHAVGNAVKRFEEQGHHGNRSGQGRSRSSTTKEKVAEMEALLKVDPHTRMSSSRKLARRMGVSHWAVRTMLKEGGYSSWKDQKRQLLTEAAKKKRRERCPKLLERFAEGQHRDVLFTDEKLFTVEQAHNQQNDRIWSRGRPPTVKRAKQRAVKPKSVMVWAGVGFNLKTPLVFIPPGVKINSAHYVDMLEREVLPWMEELDYPPIFQQDGAPAHTARATQGWCNEMFFDFVKKDEWPPSSPDLNPCDYAIWSILESRACATPHTSVESLMNALKREWEKLDQATINKIVEQFPRRLQECIDAEGGHYE
jgi:transposase